MANLGVRRGVLVAVLTFFPFITFAQDNTTISASTFFLSEPETQFSINVANDTDDISIYFSSPAYSWVGVGFGKVMKDSLMFIMYPNDDGDNVTVSPRLGNNRAEPTFAPSIDLKVLPGTTISNESMFVLKAVCSNCRKWVDSKSTSQPMFYAFGHGYPLYSDSKSADLKRHIRYGHFTMDMVAATGTGGAPASSTAVRGVTLDGKMVRDHDRANLAHAIIGCLALFVIWPLNVIIAGFFKNIKIHVGFSVAIMAFLIVSYALGISTSAQFNRSKDYKTPHQIFAFIALAPILFMSVLPTPSISKLHSLLPRLHTPLVSTAFLLLVLTGGLGLHLSSQARPVILGYTAVALMVFLFITVLTSCIRRRGSAYARANNRKRMGEDDDRAIMMLKLNESRRSSEASLRPNAYANESREFGADGQERRAAFGGGTMPGPQYLLNMHPGVPVHRW